MSGEVYYVVEVKGSNGQWGAMHPAGDFTPYKFASHEEAEAQMRARYPDQVRLVPLGLSRVRVTAMVEP